MPRWIVPLLLLLLAACASAGGPLGARRWSGPLPRARDLDSGVAAARMAIDSAAAHGDAEALARFFEPDAVVVVGNDTLRGFAAVASYYRSARPLSIGGRIELHPDRTELCTDGAYELGGTVFLVTRNRDGTADTLQPVYAARWGLGGSGGWRISAITLRSQATARAVTAGGGCRTYLAQATFPRRRVLVTFELPMSVSSASGLRVTRQLMIDRAYVVPGPLQSQDPLIGLIGLSPKEEERGPIDAGLRFRVHGPLTAEIMASVIPNGIDVTGADFTARSYVVFKARQRAIGALIGVEWRRLRLAAGPVSVRNSGTLIERRLMPIQGAWFSQTRTDEEWHSTALGWMGMAAYTWPFSASLFAEVRASWRGTTTGFRSSSAVFPSARLNSSRYALTLVVGVAP